VVFKNKFKNLNYKKERINILHRNGGDYRCAQKFYDLPREEECDNCNNQQNKRNTKKNI